MAKWCETASELLSCGHVMCDEREALNATDGQHLWMLKKLGSPVQTFSHRQYQYITKYISI
jgi:hypothetical protein